MSATRSSKQPETLSDALADARQRIEEYMKNIQAELAKIQAEVERLA